MEATRYAEEQRTRSPAYSAPSQARCAAEHGGWRGAGRRSDHHGRPDPQPQESLKNAGQVSDVVRWKEEIISFEEEIMLYDRGES